MTRTMLLSIWLALAVASAATPSSARAEGSAPTVVPPSAHDEIHCGEGTTTRTIADPDACSDHGGIVAPPLQAATALCVDATTVEDADRDTACGDHGGVAAWRICQEGDFLAQRECAQAEADQAGRELDTAYAALRAAIPGTFAAGDAPTGLGDDPSASEVLAPLEASQQAWLAYRQAQCDYAFETARGGTGTAAPYAQNLCLATVTLARVGFLRQALLDLDQRGE